MKECPSCQKQVPDKLVVCSHCGYDFEGAAEEEANTKKTMMGIPSAQLMSELKALRQKSSPQPEPTGQTMFGLPSIHVHPSAQESSELEDDDDEEDFGPTQVISPVDVPALGSSQDESAYNPRSTMPGGFPSLAGLRMPEQDKSKDAEDDYNPRKTMTLGSLSGLGFGSSASRPAAASADSEPEDDDDGFDATMVVAGPQALSLDVDENPMGDVSGFSRMGGSPDYSKDQKGATLTGLHIGALAAGLASSAGADGAKDNTRQTMFSLPNPFEGAREELLGLSEGSEDKEDQADQTQALSPGQVGQLLDESSTATPDDNRRRLLEKLKKSKPAAPEDPTRNTMFGIPGINRNSQDAQEQPPEDDSFGVKPPVASGIVRVGKRRVTQESDGVDPLGATSVLGSSSYALMAQEIATEEGYELPAHASAVPDDQFGATAVADASILSSIKDFDDQERHQQTAVASAELLSGLSSATSPASSSDSGIFTSATTVASADQFGSISLDDATAVASAELVNSFAKEAEPAEPTFEEMIGAMNQGAISHPTNPELPPQAQLQERLQHQPSRELIQTPAAASLMPALDTLERSGPQRPMPTPARPLVTPLPLEPERPLSTPTPPTTPVHSTMPSQPALGAPALQQNVPPSTNPALPTVARPHQTQPQLVGPSETSGLIKTIQLAFALLGILTLLASTGLSFSAGVPAGLGLVATAVTGLVALLGVGSIFMPSAGRKIAFIVCGGLGLGAFGLGFVASPAGLSVSLILASAGALLLVAAGVFSFLA